MIEEFSCCLGCGSYFPRCRSVNWTENCMTIEQIEPQVENQQHNKVHYVASEREIMKSDNSGVIALEYPAAAADLGLDLGWCERQERKTSSSAS